MTRKRSTRSRSARCGVYAIRHRTSGRLYIGSSNDIANRCGHHRFMLRRGLHKNAELQQAWTNNGEVSFEFVDIELCGPESLSAREEYWLVQNMNRVYNMSLLSSGYVRNEEAIRRLQEGRDRRWGRHREANR